MAENLKPDILQMGLKLKKIISTLLLTVTFLSVPMASAGGRYCQQCPAENQNCIPRPDCPNAIGFDCRNEDPHVIASLLYNQNTKQLEGSVIVGFVHGTLVCPLKSGNKGRDIECFGKYRLPSEDSFVAKLELSRTNQMAKLYLQLPSIETRSDLPVICFKK